MHIRAFVPLLALGAASCSGSRTALDVNLLLDDQVWRGAASARIVISRDPADTGNFPATMAAAMVKPGLEVENLDADGDGRIDIVVRFTRNYPLVAGANHFELVASSVPQPINVRLRAEVYDVYDNVMARLTDSQMRDYVTAVLQPGQVTGKDGGGVQLKPACLGTCSASTIYPDVAKEIRVPEAMGASLSAMAAGNLTGSTRHRADLVIGAAAESTAGAPQAGHVRVYLGPAINAMGSTKDIYGVAAGDQLGSALAVGLLDAGPNEQLVIGARGAGLEAGAIFVVSGANWWLKSSEALDLAHPASATVKRADGAAAGDRFGSALALADVDGDGVAEILVGAPGAMNGAGALYVVSMKQLGGSPVAPVLTGRPGSQLGATITVSGGTVAVGAPEDVAGGATTGAVYVLAASSLKTPQSAMQLGRWVGQGGGFGTSVALANLDASGLSVLVGSPTAGTVLVRSAASIAGTADVGGSEHGIHGDATGSLLGTAVARAAQGTLDAVVIGAPATLPSASLPDGGVPAPGDGGAPDMAVAAGPDMGVPPGDTRDPTAGAIFVVRGATITLSASLKLARDGQPAAAAAFGDSVGSGFGSHIVIGDFDEDGKLDIAVGAAVRRGFSVVPGLL